MDRSDFKAAFALPFARNTSFDTVAVGVLVTLASFTTPLAGVLLVGYVLRLVRAGGGNATALPGFDDVLDVAVEGARLSAVLVALQVPAVAIATIVFDSSSVPLSLSAAVSAPRLLSYVDFSVFGVIGLVVAGIVALAGSYLGVAATVALASERSLVAAIPLFGTLAFDTSFASVVSASAFVVFGGRLLGAFFGMLPIVGVLFTAGVSFLTLVVATTLLGRGTMSAEITVRHDTQPVFGAVASA